MMPLFQSNSFFLLMVVIICKNIVTIIKVIIDILKSAEKANGLITAPSPINSNKFIILDPDIFPSNKSVSSFLADIILVVISGNVVPIAIIVIPINFSVKPSLLAINTEFSTTKSAPNFKPNTPKII